MSRYHRSGTLHWYPLVNTLHCFCSLSDSVLMLHVFYINANKFGFCPGDLLPSAFVIYSKY